MKCRRILIIEPNQNLRNALGQRLSDREFEVRYAPDEKAALEELMRGTLPDVILLELELESGNGWKFLAAQKTMRGLPKIPTLVFSSQTRDLEVELMESLDRLCEGEDMHLHRHSTHRSPLLNLPTHLATNPAQKRRLSG